MLRFPRRFCFVPLSVMLLIGCEGDNPNDPSLDDDQLSLARGVSAELTAPSNAVATAFSQTQIDVAWQDNSGNETGFEIHRAVTESGTFTLLTRPSTNATAYRDSGLEAGVQYCYKIRSVRVRGKTIVNSAFSNTACPAAPLPAPSNVTLTGTESAISVQWRDNSVNETQFEVHRSASATGTFSLLGTRDANATWYYDGGLAEGVEHCYIVRAVGAASVSPFSDAVCGRAVPGPATNTTATPQNSFVVLVEWTAIGLNFRIDRSTDGGVVWTTVGTAYNTRIFGDQVQTVEGPLTEQQVCYRVISYTSTYNAEPSNTDCTTPPARPTSVVVTALDADTRELTWTDNSAVEEGYEVRDLVPDCFRDWDNVEYCYGHVEVFVASLPANTTSYRLSAPYTSGMSVVPKKDGGYGTGGWWMHQ